MSRAPIAPVRVVITDDSDIVTSQLSRVLGSAEGIEIVGIAHSIRELHDLVRTKRPDVVTLDLLLPVSTGVSSIGPLSQKSKVIIVSDLGEASPLAAEALARGASAYV
ncbi:MAG: response regulator, partial [Polyangiaceae bacterium]|nr:response regulator [Polyangiaceae bacterium]